MSAGLMAAIWFVVANVIGMLPSRDHHWRAAYGLLSVGLPILLAVFWQYGGWIGLMVLVAGMWILRAPVLRASRWLRRVFTG